MKVPKVGKIPSVLKIDNEDSKGATNARLEAMKARILQN
jgi:predicted nucleotide-binding protein (sugar kinase/HSP70/actin superfamily)